MSGEVLQTSLAAAVVAATPLIYAALGELLLERVGVINIGLEGMMLVGAVAGFIVAATTGSLVLAFLAGASAGAVFALIFFAIPALLAGAPQILVGFGVWFVGLGLSAQLGNGYVNENLRLTVSDWSLPLLSEIPFIGEVFFEQPWYVYLAVVLVLLAGTVTAHTRHGLNMRAIGEDAASAYASGLPVRAWQAFYVAVGGAACGIGGTVLSAAVVQTWKEDMVAGRGFVAFALVILAAWRPLNLLWGAYLFGIMLVLSDVGQAQGWAVPEPFLAMAPYVATLVILVVRAAREVLTDRPSAEPAGLGASLEPGQR